MYACGAISYPILDLAGWATGETHDFESQYLESLVGPYAEVPERYRERSPINRTDTLTAPFVLLQGLDDLICPPVQCERFLAAIEGRGIPHAYLAFEGRATASAAPTPSGALWRRNSPSTRRPSGSTGPTYPGWS